MLGGALVLFARGWVAHREADRTAQRAVSALRRVDSAELTRLSAHGSARNFLCLRKYWPPAFWSHEGNDPVPLRAGRQDKDWRYRVVGDPLTGDSARAVFDLFIHPAQPDRVASIFADSRTGVWTDEVRACLRP